MVGVRQERLEAFVEWAAKHITGDEKSQAQVFLDRLFQGFGHKGLMEAGAALEERIKKADNKGTAFADLVWKPYVLVEMKKRGEDLSRHYRQAFDYWVRLVPGRPQYVVLCNFDEFWVYDFNTQMDSPVDRVRIEDLPTRYGPLGFLFPTPERPVFGDDHEEVTRDAADKLATCFNKLANRMDRSLAQRFILQMLVALFSEDIGLLDQYFVTQLLDECKSKSDSYDLLGGLFEAMNTPGKAPGGRFKGVDYFNGGLFSEPARIELYDDELNQLKQATKFDWSKVRPEIFGTIFEHSVDQQERRAYGQHFTSHVDIMKIVGPTIVRPWRELIDDAKSIKRLLELRQRLTHLTVLDPACGSGNFLYIAYRELKRLEKSIFERISELSTKEETQKLIGFVTANQFYGIDINPLGIELAKFTMMIARKLAIDELKMPERALPLDNLDGNFIAGDALIESESRGLDGDRMNWRRPLLKDGQPVCVKWPKADVIIGNPPFNGAKKLKPDLGPDYVNAIRSAYAEVPGMADYCVLWFRKSHDHLPQCTAADPVSGRAGLVGTQNIRNNKSRVGGLDYIAASGTIIEAVDNQPWSGEANVHVSIANWVKHAPIEKKLTEREKNVIREQLLIPETKRFWFKVDAEPAKKRIRKKGSGPASKEYELAYRDCKEVNSALSDVRDVSGAVRLRCNIKPQCSFNGQMLGHDAFLITAEQRRHIVDHDAKSREVIYPYLNGREMLSGNGQPDRFVIDFGQANQLEAAGYQAAFDWVKIRVLPDRERKAEEGVDENGNVRPHHKAFLARWWQLSFARPELISLIESIPRYLCCSLVTKRSIFVLVDSAIRPSNLLQVFTFSDDYSFGVLQSDTHWQWFIQKCSKLKSDYRFGEAVFNTFPWPQSPSVEQINAVASAGCEVRRVRDEALTKIKGGLRAVYRELELPGKNPLKEAHTALDKAVLNAYGFSAKKDWLAQLLELNLEVAKRIENEEDVTAPGLPPSYPTPSDLVTDDCIRPAEASD